MKTYYYRFIQSKRSMLIMVLMILFPIVDLFLLNSQWSEKFTPNQSAFLVGNSEGHMMQILMLWFLPIYILIMVSEYYIQDVHSNSQSVQILKAGKKKYFGRQLMFSFIVAFSVMLISLLINYLLAWVINYDGTQDPYTQAIPQLSKIVNQHPEFLYSYFIITHQTLANLIFILLTSVIIGTLGSGLTAICFFFPKRVYAYFLAFALWFLDITGDYAVMITFQPFNEYPWTLLLTNIGLFLIPTLILIAASYVYKVKSDEI